MAMLIYYGFQGHKPENKNKNILETPLKIGKSRLSG
jgi:hypothetical protein